MYFGNLFPRNPDGTLKHKEPCQTEGCNWPNWHLCLDKTDPIHHMVQEAKPKRRMTQSQKDAIAESQRQRWAARRALTKERDDLIIKYYTEDRMNMSGISGVLNIAQSTVQKVLQQAQREGKLKVRPKNFTLSRPGVRSKL